jgi:hypothetical protein
VKKIVATILLLVLCASPLVADYVPYSPDEFPQWSIKLRRAETLLFGALPITLGVTSLSYAAALSLGASPLYDDTFKDTMAVIGIAGTLALVVAIADFIIGEMQD